MDPIEREDFATHKRREANPERMARIRRYAAIMRAAKKCLTREVLEAIDTGHSFRQVAKAAGTSATSIQRMVQPK